MKIIVANHTFSRLTGWVFAKSTCTCDTDPKSCNVAKD